MAVRTTAVGSSKTGTSTTRKAASADEVLTELMNKVAKEHQAILNFESKALDHAYRAGQYLTDIKGMLKKRKKAWSAWVEANLGFSKQTGDTYIRVYKNWEMLKGLKPENRSIRRADLVIAGKAEPDGTKKPKATNSATGGGEGHGAVGGKTIKVDPAKLMRRVKREGLTVGLSRAELIDFLNIVLEEAGAGVLLTTQADEDEMARPG